MAGVAWLCPPTTTALLRRPVSRTYRGGVAAEAAPPPLSVRCCCSQHHNPISLQIDRRHVLLGLASAVSFAAPIVSSPEATADTDVPQGFRIYTDEKDKFNIVIPVGWRVGAGDGEPNGFKSVTAFYPEDTTTSNVSVIVTGLGPDFTRLESFGKVDEFAETLVGGLDRSWNRPPGVAAKLLNSKSKNGFYYIDYSLQNPGENRKYLYSALGVANNGWINRLYTITGQFDEEDSEKYGSLIEKAVASFRFIPQPARTTVK